MDCNPPRHSYNKEQSLQHNNMHIFQRKYKSPLDPRDTSRVSYEQMIEEDAFDQEILPLPWRFLGIDDSARAVRLRETVR